MSTLRKKVCLVPIKNEAWILNTFLESTSLWADHIIILDQNSTDESVEIAGRFEKVVLFHNTSNSYNELERQRFLIQKSRELFGLNTILFALDADEILANYHNNPDWDKLLALPAGTAVYLPWLNVLPGNKTYFNSVGGRNVFVYIEDGREHFGTEMHSPRVPVYSPEETVFIESIKVLHYQFSVRERQLSKHRWYECLERIKYPEKDAIDLYRVYHHIDILPREILEIPAAWYSNYAENGVHLLQISDDNNHWWDKEVCALLKEKGPSAFKKQFIWYIDWDAVDKKYNGSNAMGNIGDPRNLLDKAVHKWLKASQADFRSFPNRVIGKIFRTAGWR